MSTTPPGIQSGSSPSEKPLPHLGDEYGTGKGNLPPAKIVGIVLAVLVVAVGIFAFVHRPKSPAAGSIDDVAAAEIAGQDSVLVSVTLTIQNPSQTAFKMRSVSVEVESTSGVHKDDPAPAMDFERYLAGFPSLKEHTTTPLPVASIPPGGQVKGSVLVSFPVKLDEFNQRKSLKVTATAFGEPAPLVISSK